MSGYTSIRPVPENPASPSLIRSSFVPVPRSSERWKLVPPNTQTRLGPNLWRGRTRSSEAGQGSGVSNFEVCFGTASGTGQLVGLFSRAAFWVVHVRHGRPSDLPRGSSRPSNDCPGRDCLWVKRKRFSEFGGFWDTPQSSPLCEAIDRHLEFGGW